MSDRRPITSRDVVLVLALVVFVLAFFNVEPWSGHSLVDLGLALTALGLIL